MCQDVLGALGQELFVDTCPLGMPLGTLWVCKLMSSGPYVPSAPVCSMHCSCTQKLHFRTKPERKAGHKQ